MTLRAQLAAVRETLFPRAGNALGCGKKKRYLDEGEARAVRRLRGRHEPLPLYYYQCPACDGWHLTKLRPPGWKEAM